jgi:hypothetical protein
MAFLCERLFHLSVAGVGFTCAFKSCSEKTKKRVGRKLPTYLMQENNVKFTVIMGRVFEYTIPAN